MKKRLKGNKTKRPETISVKEVKPDEQVVSRPKNLYPQTEVEVAKFQVGREVYPVQKKQPVVPPGYADNKIIAMIRDPWCIFAYWEVNVNRELSLKSELEGKGEKIEKSILRVYDITDGDMHYFDIGLKDLANNWYIKVAPDRLWYVEIGLLTYSGKFFALAKSNRVRTPRFGMSDIIDEEWMCLEEDYRKLLGYLGEFDMHKSSLEMREFFEKRIKEWLFSPISSLFLSSASLFEKQNNKKEQ